jgi:hypothetical protein
MCKQLSASAMSGICFMLGDMKRLTNYYGVMVCSLQCFRIQLST